MRRLFIAATAAAAVLASPLVPSQANAAVAAAPASIAQAAGTLSLVEHVQVYVYRGRRHCWYRTGWHGAGWYWCGYRWRRGIGWGGPAGWHGWVYRGPRVIIRRPAPRRHRGPAIIIR